MVFYKNSCCVCGGHCDWRGCCDSGGRFSVAVDGVVSFPSLLRLEGALIIGRFCLSAL